MKSIENPNSILVLVNGSAVVVNNVPRKLTNFNLKDLVVLDDVNLEPIVIGKLASIRAVLEDNASASIPDMFEKNEHNEAFVSTFDSENFRMYQKRK